LADYRRARELLGGPFYCDARSALILRHLGRRTEAEAVLEVALRDVKDHWLRQVLRCLAGRLSPEQLLADAVASGNQEHICEAFYYAGEIALLGGRAAQARELFKRCVRTGVQFDPDTSPAVPMNEFELAQWRLRGLP
jgi:hypothetical protein